MESGGGLPGIVVKSRLAPAAGAGLADVVGSTWTHDDLGTLGEEKRGCILIVGRVGQDRLGNAPVCSGASLSSVTETVCSPIVGWGQAPAVVMAELNHNPVAALFSRAWLAISP